MRFRPIVAAACQEAERIDASSVRPSFGNGLRRRLYECAAPAPHPALNGVFFQSAFFSPGGRIRGRRSWCTRPESAPFTTGACCQLSPGGRHEEGRFAERQIITVLQSSGMFYPWQSGFGGLAASDVGRMLDIEHEEAATGQDPCRRFSVFNGRLVSPLFGRPGRQMEAFSWRFTSSSTSSGVCSRRKQRRFSTISALSLGRLAVKWSGFR